ncbi:hypothetical protein CRUP_024788 [Coryphaenoides rupestris]|nr:hypothetical protein CRUP_024788 [Coryphaenoides rupestris]
MLGFVISMMGMECTFLGGKDLAKHRKVYAGGFFHIISGVLSTSGYAVYAQYVSGEYFNPHFDGLKFDLGTPLFLGWVGSAFHATGGCFYLWASCKPLCGGQVTTIVIPAVPEVPETTKSTTALSTVSEIPSKRKTSSVSKLSSSSSTTTSTSSNARSDVSGISSRSARSPGSSRSRGRRGGPRGPIRGRGQIQVARRGPAGRPGPAAGRPGPGHLGPAPVGTVSSLSDGSRNERRPFVNTNYVLKYP